MSDPGGLRGWLKGPSGPGEKPKKALSELDRRRIAVLPFSNMSPDPNDEYFADGITDELIMTISRIREVSVVSRTSVMQYRKSPKPVRDVAEELQVGTVLEGSVRKAGKMVRVTVQLIDAARDKHEWAESYDRGLEDIFAIQSDISQNVAEILKVQLFANEKKRLQNIPTRSVDAYTLFLKGRRHLNQRTEEGFYEAIRYFEESIREDPKYAAAYAGLADCYSLLENWALMRPTLAFPKAMEYAVKALELDETVADAHVSMAKCLVQMKRDWKGAEREYRRALELNPSYSTAHHWYAYELLQMQGRWDEAVREIRLAARLDPLSQIIALNKAKILFWAGRREEAMAQFRLAVNLNPESAYTRVELGSFLIYASSIEEGTAEIEKGLKLPSSNSLLKYRLAIAYMAANRKTEAEGILGELRTASTQRYAPGTLIAVVCAAIGEKDQAFEWLDRAVREGTSTMDFLSEQVFDGFRTDPRFNEILQRIGLR